MRFVLRVCEPRGLKNNQLCLAFKYKFHKDRINDMNLKALAEKPNSKKAIKDLAKLYSLTEHLSRRH